MIFTARERISEFDFELSKKQILDALCDGDFLATKTWTQEEVEDMYEYAKLMRRYRMVKQVSSDIRAEFDGYEFWSTEADSWKLVFGLSGEYGIPKEEQYTLLDITI